jgi:hypothetical protein
MGHREHLILGDTQLAGQVSHHLEPKALGLIHDLEECLAWDDAYNRFFKGFGSRSEIFSSHQGPKSHYLIPPEDSDDLDIPFFAVPKQFDPAPMDAENRPGGSSLRTDQLAGTIKLDRLLSVDFVNEMAFEGAKDTPVTDGTISAFDVGITLHLPTILAVSPHLFNLTLLTTSSPHLRSGRSHRHLDF